MALQYFTETFQHSLLKKIHEYALKECHPADRTRVFISSIAYADAFSEADFDAHFLKLRRGNHHGNSEGKLAGVLYFRLTRHQIIHISQEIVENSHYNRFQERIMVKIVGALLNVDFNHPWIRARVGQLRPQGVRFAFQDIYSELQFLTCRRHYNQESLALFFDSFVYLQHAIDDLTKAQTTIGLSQS